MIFYGVRNFFEVKRNSEARACAPEVLSYFIKENILYLKENEEGLYDKTIHESALRAVKLYTNQRGIKRGEQSGVYRIRPQH